MNAAIYCRYSSDNQRHESVEDQARNCRRWAERQGIDATTLYADEAISGSRSDRPEYQRMLADAKAGAFGVLLLDDLSRLSRDQVETEQVIRRLEHWKVRVVALDGYDSEAKGRKVQRAVKGLMNELYLDDLRDKTHRGLEGQAGRGLWTGGRPYGYTLRAIMDPTRQDAHGQSVRIGTRLEPDKDQAAIVRRIFKEFAAGKSPRAIADMLNVDGVTAPGAAWKRTRRGDARPRWLASAIYGHPKIGTGILRNDLYRGLAVWNRSRWVRDPAPASACTRCGQSPST